MERYVKVAIMMALAGALHTGIARGQARRPRVYSRIQMPRQPGINWVRYSINIRRPSSAFCRSIRRY